MTFRGNGIGYFNEPSKLRRSLVVFGLHSSPRKLHWYLRRSIVHPFLPMGGVDLKLPRTKTLFANTLLSPSPITGPSSLPIRSRLPTAILSCTWQEPASRRATKNSRRWRDAPIDKKCNPDRRIVVVCCPELERVRPVIVRGSTARPAQVHQ